MSFYFFRAQRLRRSEANVERLAPQPAVPPFGGRVRSGGSSRRTLRGRGAGDGGRDDARLHRRRGGRRRGRGLRLAHVAKADGALREQLGDQLGKDAAMAEEELGSLTPLVPGGSGQSSSRAWS